MGGEGKLVESPDNGGWFSSLLFTLFVFLIMGPLGAMEAHFTSLLTPARDVTMPLIWGPVRFLSQIRPAAFVKDFGSPSSVVSLLFMS